MDRDGVADFLRRPPRRRCNPRTSACRRPAPANARAAPRGGRGARPTCRPTSTPASSSAAALRPSEQTIGALASRSASHRRRARPPPPARRPSAPAPWRRTDHVSPALMRVLDRLDAPAQVVSDLGVTLEQNPLAEALLGVQTGYSGPARSMIYRWFTYPKSASRFPTDDHEMHARSYTARPSRRARQEPAGRRSPETPRRASPRQPRVHGAVERPRRRHPSQPAETGRAPQRRSSNPRVSDPDRREPTAGPRHLHGDARQRRRRTARVPLCHREPTIRRQQAAAVLSNPHSDGRGGLGTVAARSEGSGSADRRGCVEDHSHGAVWLGDLRDVRRPHLAGVRSGTLGHEPLGGRRDRAVRACHRVPRRDRLPGGRTRGAPEGLLGERSLRREHLVGDLAGDISGERGARPSRVRYRSVPWVPSGSGYGRVISVCRARCRCRGSSSRVAPATRPRRERTRRCRRAPRRCRDRRRRW